MIEDATAVLRMDPDKWSFAEFWRLAERRIRYDWMQTSAILSTLININRSSGEPLALDAFVPMSEAEREAEEAARANSEENRAAIESLKNFMRRTYKQPEKSNNGN